MGKTEKKTKENHATKVAKMPQTERQKFGRNETIMAELFLPKKIVNGSIAYINAICSTLIPISFI